MSLTMIGFDTAKSVFPGPRGGWFRARRDPTEKQAACSVVMEACGAAHHWARVPTGLGHDVKLIAPEAVRPS